MKHSSQQSPALVEIEERVERENRLADALPVVQQDDDVMTRAGELALVAARDELADHAAAPVENAKARVSIGPPVEHETPALPLPDRDLARGDPINFDQEGPHVLR